MAARGRHPSDQIGDSGAESELRAVGILKSELAVADGPGAVQSFSVGNHGGVAYALATPQDTAQLFLKTGNGPAQKLTNLDAANAITVESTLSTVDSVG